MDIKYIIDNNDNSLTEQFVNGGLSATTLSSTTITLTSNPVPGYVLTSDSNGNGSWSSPSDGFTYEIGQYVQSEGGVIYHRYMEGTTQKYLVVDTQDLSSGSVWSDVTNVEIGSSAQSRWNGSGNTTAITTQPGATTGAAFLCEGSTNNEKSDWYLPSIGELVKIWDNQYEVSKGLEDASGNWFDSALYWSSMEFDSSTAWYFLFYNGTSDYSNKGFTFYVRAVRQFSI